MNRLPDQCVAGSTTSGFPGNVYSSFPRVKTGCKRESIIFTLLGSQLSLNELRWMMMIIFPTFASYDRACYQNWDQNCSLAPSGFSSWHKISFSQFALNEALTCFTMSKELANPMSLSICYWLVNHTIARNACFDRSLYWYLRYLLETVILGSIIMTRSAV